MFFGTLVIEGSIGFYIGFWVHDGMILLITVSLGLFKCFGIREPWVLGYVQNLKEPLVL
jgi:hypothetical protein